MKDNTYFNPYTHTSTTKLLNWTSKIYFLLKIELHAMEIKPDMGIELDMGKLSKKKKNLQRSGSVAASWIYSSQVVAS